MSKERYEQIIEDTYKNYLLEDVGVLSNMSKEEFIIKCKTDQEFSEKWGLKIEERELSLEERLNLAAKTYEVFDPFDFGIPGKVDHEEVDKLYPVAKRIITLQYNEEKVEVYE
jgi:hypothetical protein